jgi:MFS transporter, DHA1 family, quinolone resistance protein
MSTDQNTRQIYFLYFVAFLSDLCIGIFNVSGVLLAESLGASPSQIGLVGAGAGIPYCIMPFLLGKVGDKIGRKRALIIAFCSLGSIQFYYIFFIQSWVGVFIGNLISGVIFSLIWPNLGALASEISLKDHDKVISNYMVSWSIGLTIGPLLSGIFLVYSLKIGYILMLIASITALIIILFGLDFKYSKEVKSLEQDLGSKNLPEKTVKGKSSPELKRFQYLAMFIVSFLFAFNNQIFFALFPSYALNDSGLGINSFTMGFLLFCIGLGRSIAFWLIGRVSKEKREGILIIALLVISIMMVLVAVFQIIWILVITLLIFGFFSGFLFTIGFYYTLGLSETDKGKNAGMLESIVGVGVVVSPIICGYLIEYYTLTNVPWIFGSIVSFMVFGILSYLYTKNKSRFNRNS